MLRLKMLDMAEQVKSQGEAKRASMSQQPLLYRLLRFPPPLFRCPQSCRPPTCSNKVSCNIVQWKFVEPTLTPTVRRISPHVIRSFGGESSTAVRTKAFPTARKVDLSRFAIALTSFSIPSEVQLDVSASITTPLDTGFTVSLSDPSLKSASCSWIELGDHAPDMQCGV